MLSCIDATATKASETTRWPKCVVSSWSVAAHKAYYRPTRKRPSALSYAERLPASACQCAGRRATPPSSRGALSATRAKYDGFDIKAYA